MERYTMTLVDLSRWPTEMELLDVALEKAADICHQSENNCVVILYPMPYKSMAPETAIKRTRLVEDNLMKANLSMHSKFVISFEVADEHGNEKRPLIQEARLCTSKVVCGENESEWMNSTATRGRLTNLVELVRVKDMLLPGRKPGDKDRKLGPIDRVAQKGPKACKQIIQGILDGAFKRVGDGCLIVDMLPHPLGEWAHGVWLLQREQVNVAYLGLISGDADSYLDSKSRLQGVLLEEWWSTLPEAGPATLEAGSAQRPAPPRLRLCSWSCDKPALPAGVAQRFTEGSPQAAKWAGLVEDFHRRYGNNGQPNTVTTAPTSERTVVDGEGPDFSVDGPDDWNARASPEHAGDVASMADNLCPPG